MWLRSLQNPGDGAEFLKKERFIAGLVPQIRLKVEAGEPATYLDAERRASQKYRKLKCLEEESSLRDEMIDTRRDARATIRANPTQVTTDAIEKLNESLHNLSIHFAQAIEPRGSNSRPPPAIPERENRPRRVLQCWNCGEEGHGMNNCPYPRGEPGRPNLNYPQMYAGDPPPMRPTHVLQRPNPMAREGGPLAPAQEGVVIPPLPDPNVHVIEVTSEQLEANGVKRTRGKEKEDIPMEETSAEGAKRGKKEKVRKYRRHINLNDFAMGHGIAPYNLVRDMQAKGPAINWPQFFALCPQMRRELARAVSTRVPNNKKTSVVKIAPIDAEEDVFLALQFMSYYNDPPYPNKTPFVLWLSSLLHCI